MEEEGGKWASEWIVWDKQQLKSLLYSMFSIQWSISVLNTLNVLCQAEKTVYLVDQT